MRRVWLLISLAFFLGCIAEKEDATLESSFVVQAPSNLGEVPFAERNPFSKKKIELGRMLFYDPILSGNNQISCATCHDQKRAFSDGVALGTFGASGKPSIRHSPALINLAWMDGLFWEGGAKDLESLVFAPIMHSDEMDQNFRELEKELNDHEDYPVLFKEAFGVNEISQVEIVRALAQFQRTLISANSKYDRWVRGEGEELNELEFSGFQIFEENCQSCHATDLFTDNKYHNNGLDSAWNDHSHELIYLGRYRITIDSSDLGAFKTPTLRNVMKTAPYMHDGRYSTIEEVFEHYNSGIKVSNSLDPIIIELKNQGKLKIETKEKEALIAFLKTLTDEAFLTNPDFENPF